MSTILFSQIAGKLAGTITILAYLPYFLSVINGKTKPCRSTWFVLMIAGIILAASYKAVGADSTIWVPVGFVVGPTIIFMLSIKYGTGGWNNIDLYCIFGALLGGVVWWIAQAPFIALVASLCMDCIGLIPTVRKVYYLPYSENALSWNMWLIGSIVNLFAVESWNISISLYPIYMVIGNAAIVSIIYSSRFR